jgi:hypothetical protein
VKHAQLRIATVLGVLWSVILTLGSAAQSYSMTAFAGSGNLPPGVGVPVLTCTALTVLTSAPAALFRRRINVKAPAAAARITAVAVSVPSVLIVALGLAFADESSGFVLPALFLGAGAIAAWAVALALTVSALVPPRLGVPAGCAIGLLPLLLMWLRVAT